MLSRSLRLALGLGALLLASPQGCGVDERLAATDAAAGAAGVAPLDAAGEARVAPPFIEAGGDALPDALLDASPSDGSAQADSEVDSDSLDVADAFGPVLGTKASEFSLADVNASSSTYQSYVKPSDYFGQVSAWYFGHAT